MTNFNDISTSVSKYSAVVLGAILNDRKIADLRASEALIDECLQTVWLELAPIGLTIYIKEGTTPEKLQALKTVFQSISLPFKSLSSEKPGYATCYAIPHATVFKLLFRLGFDFRDVFDMYDAARVNNRFVSESPELQNRITIILDYYRLLAAVTKNLEEVKRKLSFRCGQFDEKILSDALSSIHKLVTLVTKNIQEATDSMAAHDTIADSIKRFVLPHLVSILMHDDFSKALLGSLHFDIRTDVYSMYALLSTFLMKPIHHPQLDVNAAAKEVDNVPQLPSQQLQQGQSSKLSIKGKAGQIPPNPITGNAQLGSHMTLSCVECHNQDRPLHIIALVDVSGSMGTATNSNSRLGKIAELLSKHTIEPLKANPNHVIDIIAYGDKAGYVWGGTVSEFSTDMQAQAVLDTAQGICRVNQENLDDVARLLVTDPTILKGKQQLMEDNNHQTIVIVFSDGGHATNLEYAKINRYKGNPGSASLVRDTLIKQGIVKRETSRFLAVGVGSGLTTDILESFADNGEVMVLPDSQSIDANFVEEYSRKMQPFTRFSIDSYVVDAQNRDLLDVTKGRSLANVYEDVIESALASQIPVYFILKTIMSFLGAPQTIHYLSKGEQVDVVNKFVCSSSVIPRGGLTFFLRFDQEGQNLRRLDMQMATVSQSATIDPEVDRVVKEHERRIAIIEGTAQSSGQSLDRGAPAGRNETGRAAALGRFSYHS